MTNNVFFTAICFSLCIAVVDQQDWVASRPTVKSDLAGKQGFAVKNLVDSENNPLFYLCTFRRTCSSCKMNAANFKACEIETNVRQGFSVWAKCRDANN